MPIKALKHILRKDKESRVLLDSLGGKMGVEISVVTENGLVLYGENLDQDKYHFELSVDGSQIATLYANTIDGHYFADLICLLVKKELEKKQMGSEVLGLYREINMIYDFTEKISEKIDAESIARIALREASQIIECSQGLVLMYNAATDFLETCGVVGQTTTNGPISECQSLLKRWHLAGTSAIIPAEQLTGYSSLGHLKTLLYAPLKVKNRSLGLLILGHENEQEFTAAELKLLTTIALQSASAIESAQLYQHRLQEAQEREEAIRKIHEVSTKFVPFEFIRSLGKTKLTEVGLGDLVEREVTVLFADIRGFTNLAEGMSPENNFLFVNGFNERMGPIVRENKGFINQYLGDGFMAIFPEGSQDALRASVSMHRALEEYNEERKAKNRTPITIGIGMQVGKLIMGITGDIERMDATTISDTVNTAARIESLSKHYGTSILLTEDCRRKLTKPDEFDFRYLGLVQVKGKQKPLKILECINGDRSDLYQHKLDTLSFFNRGMKQYFAREFAMAAVTFQQILKKHEGDTSARLLLNRSAHLITKELGEDWQGIEMMQLK